MKGKSIFSKDEATLIIALIELKLKSEPSKQKSIRDKIRKLGFYASEMGVGNGYTVEDFKRVTTIVGEKKAVVKTPIAVTKLKQSTNSETIKINSLSSEAELKNLGFTGFVSIKNIINNYNLLPRTRGVYVLLFPSAKSHFVEVGSGGAFKGRNPNVSIETLQENWVKDTSIIYIGKAGAEGNSATLQSRLKQYFRFGQGEAIGHWGGRYIWQLKNAQDIIVCWKEMPTEDPRKLEKQLISSFVKQFGKRPFANLVG